MKIIRRPVHTKATLRASKLCGRTLARAAKILAERESVLYDCVRDSVDRYTCALTAWEAGYAAARS